MAATFSPTTAAELIADITSANTNGEADTIELTAGATYTFDAVEDTTDGANALPSITSTIIINGNGATIARDTAGPPPSFRLIHVGGTGDLTLNEVTITNGREQLGAGIYSVGLLTVSRCTISGNTIIGGTAFSSAGGSQGGAGGGIYLRGDVATIEESTISGNTVTGGDGADADADGGGGGGGGAAVGGGIAVISGSSPVTIINCTISGNSVTGGDGGNGDTGGTVESGGGGGGFGGDGGDGKPDSVADDGDDGTGDGAGGGGGVLDDANGGDGGYGAGGGGAGGDNGAGGTSADSAETGAGSGGGGNMTSGAGGGGGGGSGLGGGIYVDSNVTVDISHCTIADNDAAGGNGGAAAAGATDGTDGQGWGGGIFIRDSMSPGVVDMTHTIVGDNTGDMNLDVSGALNSNTFNKIETMGDGDQMLDPLGSNGGPTETHALQATSPAIDAGDPAFVAPPATDQRGATRDFNGTPDIGAYEDLGGNVAPSVDVGAGDFVADADFRLDTHQTHLFGTDVTASLVLDDGDADPVDYDVAYVSGPGGAGDTLAGITAPTTGTVAAGATISWTGTIASTEADGAYTWILAITDSFNIEVTYTIEIEVVNDLPTLDIPAGSDFGTGSDFELPVDPGDSLAIVDADLEIDDGDGDDVDITITFIDGPGTAASLAGVTEPSDDTGASVPETISWTGTVSAANAPGDYEWEVEIDDGIGAAQTFGVIITVNDLPPEHVAGLDAVSGTGLTSGAAYMGETETGETGALTLATVSDPNSTQSVTLDSVTDGVGNPTGGSGFTVTLSATSVIATPTAALEYPGDIGIHTYQVRVSDGTQTVDVYVAVTVLTGDVPLISVRETDISGPPIINGSSAPSNPDLSVRNFGEQGLGSGPTNPAIFSIENTGSTTLTLGVPSLSGDHSTDFSLNLSGFSATLPPGGTTSFRITFDPPAWPDGLGVRTATVTFTHTGNNVASPFTFGIAGIGIGGGGSSSGGGGGGFSLCALRQSTTPAWPWALPALMMVLCVVRSRRTSFRRKPESRY